MKAIILSAGVVLASQGLLSGLDLTPTQSYRELEGIKIPIVRFSDGSRKVTYQPPTQWRVSGGGDRVEIIPSEFQRALFQLRVCERPEVAAGQAEDLSKWVLSFLPEGAEDVAPKGEIVGQFTLGALPSKERTFSCNLGGRPSTVSVAWVDLGEKERLAVLVIAGEKDFKAVHEEAIRSLFSWSWND